MRDFSNAYIFRFSAIMIIIVAVLLSGAAMLLQPLQQKNVEIEKKKSILASINIESTRKNAETLYDKYIKKTLIIDAQGNEIQGENAFKIDMKEEMSKPVNERKLPVYFGVLDNGGQKVIVPLQGKGLWGPIYGYISFNEDYKTVYGATFNHDKETPGLGAEIATRDFQKQFQGKTIFDKNGKFISILVKKGGASPGSPNEVDAISGGTLTSKGLQAMLQDCLSDYVPWFNKQMKK